MKAPLVQVRGLSYAYPDGQVALRDVSFSVETGQTLGLIGSNGAGKSTLLLHLNGVLLPGTGSVCIDGLAVSRAQLAQIRRSVGLVLQDADDQLFMPTVLDDVAFGPLNQGLDAPGAQRCAEQALAQVGALHLGARPPYRLSGGEKRLVAIAGVLAMAPAVLALDEPSAGLDPRARRRLIALLAGLTQAKIIATHDLDLVLDLCTRVLVLHEGCIVADGSPQALFADAALLERCHLELPLSLQRR